MEAFLTRYADRIVGVLSCFDRIIIWGMLPMVSQAAGLAHFCREHDLPLGQLVNWAMGLRDEMEKQLRDLAETAGVEFEYLASKQVRKEARIQEILAQRGDHPGLVHIFASVEPSRVFKVFAGRQNQPYLRLLRTPCKHFYVYFIDPQFGLCHLRVASWLPFPVQFYCNGHSWLARALQNEGIACTQVDNAFTACDDWSRAQKLAQEFPMRELHQALDGWMTQYFPVFRQLAPTTTYHWSLSQVECSTDVVFSSAEALRPVYAHLREQAILTVQAEDIANFLGHSLPSNPAEAGISSSLRKLESGTRVRHHWGQHTSLKMYDKHGVILRLETTTSDVSFFRHHREVEHRDGSRSIQFKPMRNTLYSLRVLALCMTACNRRYLTYLSTLADPTDGATALDRLGEPVEAHGRTYRGFNLFSRADLELFLALTRGEWSIRGFANVDLRKLLPHYTAGKVSRLLKRLRLRGLIHRMTRSYRYRLSEAGQRIILAALHMRRHELMPAAGTL